MDWIQQWQSKLNKQNGVAPLVRTGGSRHTGLAALPYRNIQYIVHLCGDTVILSNGLLVQALSRLPAQKQEMLYLSFFKRMPQHEIGRRYGRSRSAVGYHIRKAIQQLYEEMEGLAHEE